MKGFTRLFCMSKLFTGAAEKLYCRTWKPSSYNIQCSRLNHKKKFNFEGPGLKDFINKEDGTKNAGLRSDKNLSEGVPYINDLSLNGNGRKVLFEIYGCQMNVSDAEIILSILEKNGYQRTTELKEADVVLIITCSIRDSAEVGIWARLNQLKAFKIRSKKRDMKIGILGCMAERLKTKVLEIDKSVDIIGGPDSYKDLPKLLALTRDNQKGVNILLSLDETYADVMPVRLNQNDVTAYISIMRGCDNMCTYCIVPFTRGKERSRPMDSILDEVRHLSDQGVKQITLLGDTIIAKTICLLSGQNVNSYRDVSSLDDMGQNESPTKLAPGFKTVYKAKLGGLRFDTLLEKVSEINPEMRIRFTSPHPKDFPKEVLSLIQERKNICCSLHLPVQSGSNTILERMRRGYTREAYIKLVENIRSVMPDVTITTDIITGFCGETEEDHQETLDLIRLIQYNFIYFYPYSMREKTTAYRRYVDDVPKDVKMRRMLEIREACRSICIKLNEAQINKVQLILVEGISKRSNDHLAGRNDGNIKVIIPNSRIPTKFGSTETDFIKRGDYIAVTINEASSQVLKGVPLYHTTLSEFNSVETVQGRLLSC